jgi:hypothetical protein
MVSSTMDEMLRRVPSALFRATHFVTVREKESEMQ